MIYYGTAAWNIPRIADDSFPQDGSHLERYSKVLNAVEINTSFYKDHMPKSYAKWAEATPEKFRFSVKRNQRFTHERDLKINTDDLAENLKGINELGNKWGALLLQFPKSIDFNPSKMQRFYQTIRRNYKGPVVLEARNMSWMSDLSLKLFREFNISKVTADPEKCPVKLNNETEYFRLHGSPEIYKSDYDQAYLENLFSEMNNINKDVWCIFDNTTFGYATQNAITIKNLTEKYQGEIYERHSRSHANGAGDLHTFNQY